MLITTMSVDSLADEASTILIAYIISKLAGFNLNGYIGILVYFILFCNVL